MNMPKQLLTPRAVAKKLTQLESEALVAQILFIASEDLRAGATPKPTGRRLGDLLLSAQKLWKEHSA